MSEPNASALLLATFGLLLAASVIFSRTLERLGVPVVLLFLILGMLAGSEGLGGIEFDNYRFAFRIGTVALILILFDGGMNTPLRAIRGGIRPASVLATIGVAGTAALVALWSSMLGLPIEQAMLLGAVVSSTDAAAVFSVLRGSGLNLQRRVGVTLELESGLNDPMAIILTIAITFSIINGTPPISWDMLWQVPMQLAIGGVLGVMFGYGAAWLLRRIRLRAGGLFPVLTLAVAFLSFGITTMLNGSGFLAVYATAVVLGNPPGGPIPYRNGLTRIHDALAWLGQITMFLMLGLLVYPSQLLDVLWLGLSIAMFLIIARMIVVWACLLPFRYPSREINYIGWTGLRGAVPIILATFPVMAGVPGAAHVFNIVFFVVVINALIPGSTLRYMTRKLKLEVAEPPAPAAALEINSMQALEGDILSFFIDESLAVTGVPLSRVKFPEGSAIILVVRGQELIAARGYTVLEPGDHVYVFCRPEERGHMELLFGRPQDE